MWRTRFYMPEYFYKMLETLNIAIFSTMIGMSLRLHALLLRGAAT